MSYNTTYSIISQIKTINVYIQLKLHHIFRQKAKFFNTKQRELSREWVFQPKNGQNHRVIRTHFS